VPSTPKFPLERRREGGCSPRRGAVQHAREIIILASPLSPSFLETRRSTTGTRAQWGESERSLGVSAASARDPTLRMSHFIWGFVNTPIGVSLSRKAHGEPRPFGSRSLALFGAGDPVHSCPAGLVQLLRPYLARLSAQSNSALGLTPREIDVLTWVAAGKTNAETADLLSIAPGTVKKHLDHIYEKLGVSTRTEAAVTALGSLPSSAVRATVCLSPGRRSRVVRRCRRFPQFPLVRSARVTEEVQSALL
jgi:DNA-binding CsgD family transcriptional regulator